MRLDLSNGEDSTTAAFEFNEPALFDQDLSAGFSLYYRENDFDDEKKVILEEIAMRDDDPSDLVHDEFMVGMAVMGDDDEILVWAGQRYLRMGMKDIEHFRGDRAHRGRKLPRGFQRVSLIELG